LSRPITGHGPGAFKTLYGRTKPPEAEMAQLAHNDYLQQACDSGFPGAIGYATFVWGAIACAYRRRGDAIVLGQAVGLGLVGWFAQGFIEFGLYVPATAWCAFSLLGWLLGTLSGEKASRAQAPSGSVMPCR
jgi:O-antigen ligase